LQWKIQLAFGYWGP
jgi:hypothetical protein